MKGSALTIWVCLFRAPSCPPTWNPPESPHMRHPICAHVCVRASQDLTPIGTANGSVVVAPLQIPPSQLMFFQNSVFHGKRALPPFLVQGRLNSRVPGWGCGEKVKRNPTATTPGVPRSHHRRTPRSFVQNQNPPKPLSRLGGLSKSPRTLVTLFFLNKDLHKAGISLPEC